MITSTDTCIVKQSSSKESPPLTHYGVGFDAKQNNILSSTTIFALAIFLLFNITLSLVASDGRLHYHDQFGGSCLTKVITAVFDSPYEYNHCGTWPWWLARAYLTAVPGAGSAPDIAILGDSQVNAAFVQTDAMTTKKPIDCATDRYCITLIRSLRKKKANSDKIFAVNLAVGGAMPSDYYLISKSLFSKKRHPKLVIVTVSPRSFFDATFPAADSTECFQFFSSFVELGYLVNDTFSNPIQKYLWLIKKCFFLLTCQQSIVEYMHKHLSDCLDELLPIGAYGQTNLRSASGSNHPAFIYSGNGLIAMGTNMVYPQPLLTFLDNRSEYVRRFGQLKPRTAFVQYNYFQATLEYLNEIGAQVIVVNMPVFGAVEELLSIPIRQNYIQFLCQSSHSVKAYFLDLSDSKDFTKQKFLDYVHLNAFGGEHFIETLSTFIQKNITL